MPLTLDEQILIREAAAAIDLGLPPAALEQLSLLLDLTYGGVSHRRLTAVPRAAAPSRHLVDSLLLAPHLPTEAQVLDLGSGAGFPGLVLAVIRPDLTLELAERSTAKSSFLSLAVAELALDPKRVVVSGRDVRVGTVERSALGGLVSRATLGPEALLRIGRRALRSGGRLILQLGPKTLAEYAALKRPGFRELERRQYTLPGQEATLSLAVLEKRERR